MTRIDFYVLRQADVSAQEHFACRLVEKAWRLGHRIQVHTASAQAAERLDELLWAWKPESFIPHARLPAPDSVPVHIGHGGEAGGHHDLLVNLDSQVPAFFSRFTRLAEIVTQEPAQVALSRERFRFYRERGYPLETHNLKG